MKTKIIETMKKHIDTVNSFVDEKGINRFDMCVNELLQLFRDEIINERLRTTSQLNRDIFSFMRDYVGLTGIYPTPTIVQAKFNMKSRQNADNHLSVIKKRLKDLVVF